LLEVGNTYVMQNFSVVPNDSEWRVSNHPYRLFFVKTTCINVEPRPEIPPNVYHFTAFEHILNGQARTHTLVGMKICFFISL
jgi:hypothetical protein